jgi:hypothetical protein
MPKNVTVTATVPAKIPISKRASSQGLKVSVKIAGSKEGTLNVGHGSVEWWPDHNSVHAHSLPWAKFIELLERMPERRSRKTLKKSA